MSYKKFNQHKNGKYWDNYFQNGLEFYRLIQKHMKEILAGKSTRGLDIGAGPGVGARLAADAKLDTILIGYEPSDTHNDGVKLSKKLKAEKSPTTYIPRKGGIETISGIEEGSLDYIIISRACHEIADSLGGIDILMEHIAETKKLLKFGGKIIIGEPQFSVKITEHPEEYSDLIKAIQKYQQETIGHSHIPQDYITYSKLEEKFKQLGLVLQKSDLLQHKSVLQHLREQGYNLKESPNMFYIETFSNIRDSVNKYKISADKLKSLFDYDDRNIMNLSGVVMPYVDESSVSVKSFREIEYKNLKTIVEFVEKNIPKEEWESFMSTIVQRRKDYIGCKPCPLHVAMSEAMSAIRGYEKRKEMLKDERKFIDYPDFLKPRIPKGIDSYRFEKIGYLAEFVSVMNDDYAKSFCCQIQEHKVKRHKS